MGAHSRGVSTSQNPCAVHGPAEGCDHGGPGAEILLHPGAAQVHEAIAQAVCLLGVGAVVNGERRRLGHVEHLDLAVPELHLARRQPVVDRALGTSPHRPRDGHDVLAADVDRARHHALEDAGPVPEVDKGQVLAVLPPVRDPAGHPDLPADVLQSHPAAEMGTKRRGVAGHGVASLVALTNCPRKLPSCRSSRRPAGRAPVMTCRSWRAPCRGRRREVPAPARHPPGPWRGRRHRPHRLRRGRHAVAVRSRCPPRAPCDRR